jgi:PAS domain S-box-containing protein
MVQKTNPVRLFFEILACFSIAALVAMLLLPRMALNADSALTLPTSVMLILLLSGPLLLWRSLAAGVQKTHASRQAPIRSLRSALFLTFTTLCIGLAVSALLALQLRLDIPQGWLFGLSGAVLSSFVALLVWLLAFGKARARDDERVTIDLQRLAKVVEYTSNAVIITDVERRIVWVNQGFVRVTGYTPEQVIGHLPSELLQFEKTDPNEIERLRQALNERKPFKGELLNRGHNGREYWLEIEVQPLFEADGTLSGFMAIESDISERKAMEIEVRRSQAILRGAIDTVDEAFILFDPEDRLVLCNDKYREIYALSDDLIVPGSSFESIIVGGAQRGQYSVATRQVDSWVDERLAAHRSGNVSLIQKLVDGRTIRVVERRMSDGHTVSFSNDITDLVKATEAAQESVRAKGQFLANMSHEIRTPMNAIIGMTALALEGELNADQRDLIGIVKDSADSLLRLINDILDFSKMEDGQLQFEHIDFDLRECLGATVRTLAVKAREQGLALDWAVASDVPQRVLGDPHRLRQVMLNLLSNGIKFTPQGGISVAVSMRTDASAVGKEPVIHFRVCDTGIGIPTAMTELIFKPFTQADTSTTREFGGTGLGLSICRSLIAQMGGSLWVQSIEGQGSTFHFTVRLPSAETVRSTIAAAHLSAHAGPMVLVLQPVGFDPVLLECLSHWNMQPVLFDDWTAASRALDAQRGVESVHTLLVSSLMLPFAEIATIDKMLASPAQRARVILLADESADPMKVELFERAVPWPSPPSMLFDALTHVDGFADSAFAGFETTEMHQLEAGNSGRRILLAEDNPINQKLALRLLEQLGHDVEVVDNGALAVKRCAEERFDLIFLDVQMPVMGGFEATTSIRVHDRQKGVYTPIVAMTALAMAGDRDRCLVVGMDGYISKPISKAALDAAVREHALRSMRSVAENHVNSGEAPFVDGTIDFEYPSHGAAPLQDQHLALQRLGGNVELYNELAGMFVNSVVDDANRLRAALVNGDFTTLSREAHAVRGAVGALAAEPARDLAAAMELAGERGDAMAAQKILPQLEAALMALAQALTNVSKLTSVAGVTRDGNQF